MEKLPQEIILDIISSLPHQSIINCKLVCKRWRDLLSDTQLGLLFLVGRQRHIRKDLQLCHGGQEYNDIDMHGRRYSYKTLVNFDNHPTTSPADSWYRMVGSCNGLVCFSVVHDCMYDPNYICNPVTGEFATLPEYILVDGDCDPNFRFGGGLINGFGYNYSTDEYKVVRMYTRPSYPTKELSLKVQVYTLGSGLGWRCKGRAEFFISRMEAGVCANGAIHWMEISKRKIVAFDLADEKFIMIPLPSSVCKVYFGEATLKLLRGYLSVFHVEEGRCVDIWSLKKKKQCNGYGMGEDEFDNYWSWNKEFSIPWDGTKAKYYNMSSYHPFAVTKSNQVLLWFNGVLSCYDAKTSTLTQLWDDDSSRRIWVEAFPHLNSLVSLQTVGEKSKKRREIAST